MLAHPAANVVGRAAVNELVIGIGRDHVAIPALFHFSVLNDWPTGFGDFGLGLNSELRCDPQHY